MRRSSLSIGALVLAATLGAPACGTPPSSSAGATTTTTTEAPKAASAEATLFAPQRSILADLPVAKLLAKDTPAVLAVRDPATILAKLATLSAFAEAKDPLAKAIDEAAKDLTKDLPDLADLANHGVDLSKPAGVIWTDAELDTIALFASVSDEAAMKRWIDARASQSRSRRETITIDDAVVLRAKRDVTRAIVLRKGHVFWVRTKDRFGLDPDRVTRATESLAKTAEADSLASDPTFTKTLESLAYGAQATLYVPAGRLAGSLLTSRAKRLEDAKKKRDEAAAALADAEKKKRKSAAESAKYDFDQAESAVRSAERDAKRAGVLAPIQDEIPAFAAGIDLGDREVRLKAFLPTAKPRAAATDAHCPLDPDLLAFLADHLHLRSFDKAALPPPPSAWSTSTDHPVLKQIAAIDGACGVLAFEAEAYRDLPSRDRSGLQDALRDAGVLGSLFGPATKKSKKLDEQRAKIAASLRDLDTAFDAHANDTWRAFTARVGTTALFVKPAPGGLALHGGLFTKEPSLTALVDAALTAWLTAGPRWEKWTERAALQKQLRDLDAEIEAERQKGLDDFFGPGGVAGSALDPMLSGPTRPRGVSRFDDDLGSLLADPHFGGPDAPGPRGGSAVVPGAAGGPPHKPGDVPGGPSPPKP